MQTFVATMKQRRVTCSVRPAALQALAQANADVTQVTILVCVASEFTKVFMSLYCPNTRSIQADQAESALAGWTESA